MHKPGRILRNVLVALLAAALLQGCGLKKKFSEIKLTSFELASFKPSGLKAFDALVDVGISNPAPSFDIKHLNAVVRKDTSAILHLSAENVSVDGKGEKVYRVPVRGYLDPQYTLMDLAFLASHFNPEGYMVDITARAELGADIGKDLEYKDVPLGKFLRKE